jgi:transcriptional regulator of arginine metabolism
MYKFTIMKSKTQRLMTVRRILENEKISSQEELLDKLAGEGHTVTQATLSRDLRFLGAGKVPDKRKGYIYRISGSGTEPVNGFTGAPYPVNGFISIEFAHHLGVIRTMPGSANSIAYQIDHLDAFEIMGTVAGDDTILIIPREGVTKEDVLNILVQLIPEIAEKA